MSKHTSSRRLLFVPVGLVALIAGFFLVEFGIHRAQVSRRQSQLEALPVPQKTKSVFAYGTFGVVFGGSNHGDYLALRVMETSLSRPQIEAFYKKHLKRHSTELSWLDPKGHIEETPRIGSEGTTLQAYPGTFHVLHGWKRKRPSLQPTKRYFVLSNSCAYCFVVDSGFFSF